MQYFFMRTNAINLLLAIRTANTKFFIFEQFVCMAEMIESRIPGLIGKILTECVRKMNGLFETEKCHNNTDRPTDYSLIKLL